MHTVQRIRAIRNSDRCSLNSSDIDERHIMVELRPVTRGGLVGMSLLRFECFILSAQGRAYDSIAREVLRLIRSGQEARLFG